MSRYVHNPNGQIDLLTVRFREEGKRAIKYATFDDERAKARRAEMRTLLGSEWTDTFGIPLDELEKDALPFSGHRIWMLACYARYLKADVSKSGLLDAIVLESISIAKTEPEGGKTNWWLHEVIVNITDKEERSEFAAFVLLDACLVKLEALHRDSAADTIQSGWTMAEATQMVKRCMVEHYPAPKPKYWIVAKANEGIEVLKDKADIDDIPTVFIVAVSYIAIAGLLKVISFYQLWYRIDEVCSSTYLAPYSRQQCWQRAQI